MGVPFGVSFLPGGDAQYQRGQDPSGQGAGGAPVQQAIKILSMRVPRVVGQSPIAPLSLLTGPGGQGLPPGLLDQLLRQRAPMPTGGVPQAMVPPPIPSGPMAQAPAPPMAAPPMPGMASPIMPVPQSAPMPAPRPINAPVITGAPSGPPQSAPTGPPSLPSTPYTPKVTFQDRPVDDPPVPVPPASLPDRMGPDRTREGEDVARSGNDQRRSDFSGGSMPVAQTIPIPGPPGQQARAGDTYGNQDQTDEQMRRILGMLLGGGRERAQF